MVNHICKTIIVEHPLFRNQEHVLAYVMEQTRSTYSLKYWNSRKKFWDDQIIRRRIGYAVVVDSSNLANLDKLSDKLKSWATVRRHGIQQIEQQYLARLEKLGIKNDH